MPVLDYKEIPPSNTLEGQDRFELFARDVLEMVGYRVVSSPNRGQDGGRDLLIEEVRTGIGGTTTVRWLVSCKHYALRNVSVGVSEETDLMDRLARTNSRGFMGFYSTIASSGLARKLEELSPFEHKIYDCELIESTLLRSPIGISLARRYFPRSIGTYLAENPREALVRVEIEQLVCEECGKPLLDNPDMSIVVIGEKRRVHPREVIYVYWCCKGVCDQKLGVKYDKQYDGVDGWEDLGNLCTPTLHLRWGVAIMNQLFSGVHYSEEAFSQIKKLWIAIFPRIARSLTAEENGRLDRLFKIPSIFGGLGES